MQGKKRTILVRFCIVQYFRAQVNGFFAPARHFLDDFARFRSRESSQQVLRVAEQPLERERIEVGVDDAVCGVRLGQGGVGILVDDAVQIQFP